MYGNNYPYPMPNYYERMNAMTRPQQQELVRVTGMSGAQAYQMSPNSTAALFDANDDLMYIKSTDGAGFATIKTFSFKPHEAPAEAHNEYATKADLDALREELMNYGKQSVRKQAESAGK